MNELIKITEKEGRQLVSARELHKFLNVTERFASWVERQSQYGFEEGVDYVGCKEFNTLANQELIDYALTVDTAKHWAMMQRSERGMQARKYFLECERVAKESNKVLTQAEIVLQMAQMNVENERRILSLQKENKEIKEQVELIDARTQTRPDYFSVIGFASLNHISIGFDRAKILGKSASYLCKKIGVEIDKVTDQRFGKVNAYPSNILRDVFKSNGFQVQ